MSDFQLFFPRSARNQVVVTTDSFHFYSLLMMACLSIRSFADKYSPTYVPPAENCPIQFDNMANDLNARCQLDNRNSINGNIVWTALMAGVPILNEYVEHVNDAPDSPPFTSQPATYMRLVYSTLNMLEEWNAARMVAERVIHGQHWATSNTPVFNAKVKDWPKRLDLFGGEEG